MTSARRVSRPGRRAHQRGRRGLILAVAAVLCARASVLVGATQSWIGPAGDDWADPTAWSGGSVPAGASGGGDTVVFTPATTASYIYDGNYSTSSPLGTISFGTPAPTGPTLTQAGTHQRLAAEEEYFDTGTYSQNAGTNAILNTLSLGNDPSSTTSYDLSSGTLVDTTLVVANTGSATLTQTGGLSKSMWNLYVGLNAGGAGTYSLVSGSLSVLNDAASSTLGTFIGYAGSNGTFLQSGGASSLGLGGLYLGFQGAGTVVLSGGSLVTGSVDELAYSDGNSIFGLQGAGTFIQTAGSSEFDSSIEVGQGPYGNPTGFVSLSGGTLSGTSMNLGFIGGSGTYAQSGGLASFSGSLTLGVPDAAPALDATGTVLLTGGSLSAAATTVGTGGGAGTFIQSAGSCSLGTLIIGQGTGSLNASFGIVALSGGTLAANSTQIGAGGVGTFLQSGSQTVSSLGQLIVARGTPGYLSVSGGTLTASSTSLGVLVGTTQLGIASMVQSGGFSSLGVLGIQDGSTLTINAGTVQAQQIVAAGVITINGGTLQLVGPNPGGSLIGPTNLTIATGSGGGRFDITNHAFILPYVGTSPIGELTPTRHTQSYPTNSIQRYLQTAIDGGAWDGPGITSSTAENDITGTTAVGAVDNADLLALQGNNYTGSTWLGQSITSDNTVLVRYTYYGDTNLDGIVNGIDVDNLIQGFEGFGDGWLYGDFNYDGIVDSLDVTEMIIGYSGQGKPLGDGISPGQAQFLLSLEAGLTSAQIARFDRIVGVPEPASVGLGAWSIGLGLFARRRRFRLP